ncbi:MAG: hypothetical protein QXO37_06800 [Candidatus Nitrosocaldaceae archaeon]
MKIEELISDNELLIWARDTWGSWGQHDNIYTFMLNLDTLQSVPLYSLLTTRVENNDSRKNVHRKTFTLLADLKKLMTTSIIKIVHDYASSSNRKITVSYYKYDTSNDTFVELSHRQLRDADGYYDEVKYDDEIIIIRKDKIEVKPISEQV